MKVTVIRSVCHHLGAPHYIKHTIALMILHVRAHSSSLSLLFLLLGWHPTVSTRLMISLSLALLFLLLGWHPTVSTHTHSLSLSYFLLLLLFPQLCTLPSAPLKSSSDFHTGCLHQPEADHFRPRIRQTHNHHPQWALSFLTPYL